ncbi:hypothetical protein GCM10010168_20590 [Actinoplanes ianthinogenes]|uniref:Uncharacterized protein n=1 Tax=Actinoplanes ianthinogenes TaxID=122358 RepID=A0ABM7M7R8_9ACTN|nr:hypothetical protein [Actinoplanes ianthinogenes]BCJ47700.1 hypothetical protein Aiant_83570 [Actinoplanes ianthinogenes]GGR03567.1 hypothetical protein GCM10010168_20590 [Actinoplanes ianthinogenes]
MAIAAGAVVIVWLGLAHQLVRPESYQHYARTMVQVAESAHDAAQTGRLVAEQQLAGRVTGAFSTAAYADATKGLAGAQQKFAAQGPPDEASRRLRDELSPLLGQAVVALGDASTADDDQTRELSAGRLGDLAGKLRQFVEAYA